ncbi:dihydrolipoamide acetyltransferase family protein [Flammeovirgaceae bacterium SG7u.111]|nr:dihydrolipoamide acetyltransferase family protein [Flammeovirgaceae bacterium SG7u.132]WPO35118.1 dihydrolipoamide acetyltransferase family protein [Flammeovirgaceae bacterium SG7u.111]
MAVVEMVMPRMGESVMEGTILKWLKQPGETIEQDESVLEVATDKVDTDVPAPFSGVLKEILAKEGDIVEVDKPIALIETEELAEVEADAPEAPAQVAETSGAAAVQPTASTSNGSHTSSTQTLRFYSPLVMNIARQENISSAELETIPGSGKEGRVTKNDILGYVEQKKTAPAESQPVVAAQVAKPAPQPTIAFEAPKVIKSVNGQDEIIEMDRMRKLIANRMVESKRISPHVSSFVEADVTGIVEWRNREKAVFKKNYNGNLTFTPIFIQAIARALRDFPMVNISVDGDKIIVKKEVNIGVAVALPSGNLIVPVIKNADHLTLTGLAVKVNDLAERARTNQLQPDELSGGTYTVSNVGSFGNVMGTPIIMQPQVAIMAVGAIKKKPAVVETPQGDFIGIRHLMFLSHSYDHRVVDGSLGGMFVKRVSDYLENFDTDQRV